MWTLFMYFGNEIYSALTLGPVVPWSMNTPPPAVSCWLVPALDRAHLCWNTGASHAHVLRLTCDIHMAWCCHSSCLCEGEQGLRFWISQICAVHVNSKADCSSQWTQHMVFHPQHKDTRALYVAGSPLSAGESDRSQSIPFISHVRSPGSCAAASYPHTHRNLICVEDCYTYIVGVKGSVFWQSACPQASALRAQ